MSDAEQSPSTTSALDRRTVFRGLAVGGVALPLLAACGGGGSDAADPGGSGGSGASGASGGATVAKSAVPEGGGKVLAAQKVVVTQPTKGDFKAFTAVCTHQGCIVSKVEGGEIVCPCHSSHFSIQDGSPVSGPAQSPLASKKVTVEGDQISVS
jgi:nitrite reductase/ring-hydroxylating ferredoxin subunit